jgi:hypothetical protein
MKIFEIVEYNGKRIVLPDLSSPNKPEGPIECYSCEGIFESKDVHMASIPGDSHHYYCRDCVRMIVLAELKNQQKMSGGS